ncbi:class I SAM-dependent methyltransferase [Arcobacter sp.]|uniref:class I SAM-dependent methyltransferase n=1 Tax=Arcobacter sp. TaxID=1872629 RepID=UPI003D0CBCD0
MKTPNQIKKIYDSGQNIIKFLKSQNNTTQNTKDMIALSYDLQAGTYTNKWRDPNLKPLLEKYTKEISDVILSIYNPKTILEAGIGEATTMGGVLKNLDKDIESYGFDISWSRVKYAKKWLESHNFQNTKLCTGDMFNMPFCDNSIDVVYTAHSIEPNGGKEKEIIEELYRVAKYYVILVEPDYDIASEEEKRRMDEHGYCKNLKEISNNLGYEVVDYKIFKNPLNIQNPTSAIVIKKSNFDLNNKDNHIFACPRYKTPLIKTKDGYFSEEALSMYPSIDGIPCLRIENSILASKYETN